MCSSNSSRYFFINAAAGIAAASPKGQMVLPMKEAPSKMKVVPLPMMLATRYNEYFQTYRKVMGLK